MPFKTPETEKLVNELLKKMTLEEKVAQLCGVRPMDLTENGKFSLKKCRERIPHGIGQISQFACGVNMSPDDLREFVLEIQKYLTEETPSGIPAVFHEEAITGVAAKGATIYPQVIGLACSWNTELAEKKTRQTAAAMRAIGGSLALSPVIDIIRTAHWSRIEESYGEDPYLTSAMGVAFVKGLQYHGLEKGVAACTKHFLGYGGGSTLDYREIIEEVLMPHEAIMKEAGSKVLMTSYGKFRSEQAVSSDTLLKQILRGYLQFDGIVVSDYWAVSHSMQQGETDQFKQWAIEAINAGNDLELPDGDTYKYLPEALAEGLVSEMRFDEAVRMALTLKARVGLLNSNVEFCHKGELDLDKPESRQTSYELACQSVVMLKNNGILPLGNKEQKIALVGPNAKTFWCMLGDYTYQSMRAFWYSEAVDPNSPKIVSLHEALTNKLAKGTSIVYERGCDWSSAKETRLATTSEADPRISRLKMIFMGSTDITDWHKAVQVASESDVIIAALGENPTLCGEARERKGIRLPGDQESFLKELITTGKPVVLVIFGGRPQVIGENEKGCAAILQAWFPGEEGGNAVADIILGNVNPSAKLCVSYPSTEDTEQYCYNYGSDHSRISYPFGFGLSYTQFEYRNFEIPPETDLYAEYFIVSCLIKNTGNREGTEIVQLYASPANGQPLKPIQLKGFERIELLPGEEKEIVFKVSPKLLSYYTNSEWIVDPGRYSFKIGASSTDIRLEADIVLVGNPIRMEWRSEFFSK